MTSINRIPAIAERRPQTSLMNRIPAIAERRPQTSLMIPCLIWAVLIFLPFCIALLFFNPVFPIDYIIFAVMNFILVVVIMIDFLGLKIE